MDGPYCARRNHPETPAIGTGRARPPDASRAIAASTVSVSLACRHRYTGEHPSTRWGRGPVAGADWRAVTQIPADAVSLSVRPRARVATTARTKITTKNNCLGRPPVAGEKGKPRDEYLRTKELGCASARVSRAVKSRLQP
jgi:hypothetical protein